MGVLDDAIKLLEDKNLVWSQDLDTMRVELAQLMRKAADVQYRELEVELDRLAQQITNEGSNNARGFDTTN